jgi:asparagine synthase (glutamine-hydrolysing)
MCGIAGVATTAPESALSRRAFMATDRLHHRGPDETRLLTVTDGVARVVEPDAEPTAADIVAGACRLSIIDLEGGHQPLANETATIWVTFNGEIYNQLALRHELERLGHRFRTHADTEVIVHGWEEWQTALFPRLNGIFAFAIVDLVRHEVVLARDPLGVKPLYIGTGPAYTWWCSELAAAEQAGLCRDELCPDALRLFLTFRFVPSPYAVRESAWKLPPGSYVRLASADAGRPPRFDRYSSRIRSPLEPSRRSEWREALMAELEAAVCRQLASDVPVASLLSGGIDSTLTTLFMKEHLPVPPQTFGVGFAADAQGSEAAAAAAAAGELGVPHRSTTLPDGDYEAGWPSLVARMGEPTANTSSWILHRICVEVGMSHKVALCGQGADELLGGYPRHMVERLYQLGRRAPALAGLAASRIYCSDAGPRVRRVVGTQDRVDRYVNIFAHVSPEEADALMPAGTGTTRELARAVIGEWTANEGSADPLNELLRVDARVSLADDLLMVADLCSMYESVELRVPFLDLAFVELVERMPSRYKIGPLGGRKRLYREAAARRLPAASSRRLAASLRPWQPKRGFSPPRGSRSVPSNATVDAERLRPLRDLGMFDEISLLAAFRDGGELERHRSVLAALSTWLAARESPIASPA